MVDRADAGGAGEITAKMTEDAEIQLKQSGRRP
jgi:hypothetical protein